MTTKYLTPLLLLVATSAFPNPQPVSLQCPEHLKLHKPDSANPSASAEIHVDVTIAKGFHVQANPVSREGLIATEVQIDPAPHLQFSSFKYPKGSPIKLNQLGSDVMTYAGSFQVAFTVSGDAPVTAKTLVHAHLRYQACDEKTCFRPTSIPFEFWVEKP